MSTLTAGARLQGSAHAYVLERQLGSGGFGVTWLARREGDGLQVALKQLHVQRGADPKSLELFKREINTLRHLDHPRIPDYVDDFMHDGLVLVQEFVEGQDLSAAVRGEASMDEGQVVNWLAQVLEILVYLHGRTPPIIHRDITPRNIIVKPDGTAYLVDFGAVKLGIAGSMASTSTGTFGYAPMEQFVSQAFPASDLYGLGMTAVAVAAGKAPVDMTFSRMRVDVRGITRLDPRLTRLLERMTEPDPERRLGDARVALEQLRPLVVRAASTHGTALRNLALQRAPAVAGRGASPDEDLLPSERIREAGLRLQTLEAPWGVPPLEGTVEDLDGVQISPDGTIIVADAEVIDAERMTVIGRLDAGMHPVAVGVAGEVIVARPDSHAAELAVYRRAAKGWTRAGSLSTGSAEKVTLSPDGRLVAVITGFFSNREGELLLFDVESGQLNQRVPGKYEAVGFSADGSTIAAIDDDNVLRLLAASGAAEQIPDCRGVAYSPDGQTMALIRDRALHIGPVTSPGAGRSLKLDGYSVRHPRFSPDGRWFAMVDYSNDRALVVEVATGKLIASLSSPGRPGARIGSPAALGFSADGERLFVGCDVHYNRYVDEDEDCLAIWRLPDLAFLGALVGEDDRARVLAVSAEGFFGRLDGKGASDKAWRRPDVARRLLCGVPVDELIDSPSRAALADLETRWAFIRDLKAQGRLDDGAANAPLLDALNGLTHVLDAVVEHARAAQASRPTFGGGATSAVALTGDQLLAAARAFAARPKAELEQAHQALIARAEAAEAQAAAQAPATRETARDKARGKAAPGRLAPDAPDNPGGRRAILLAGVVVVIGIIVGVLTML